MEFVLAWFALESYKRLYFKYEVGWQGWKFAYET